MLKYTVILIILSLLVFFNPTTFKKIFSNINLALFNFLKCFKIEFVNGSSSIFCFSCIEDMVCSGNFFNYILFIFFYIFFKKARFWAKIGFFTAIFLEYLADIYVNLKTFLYSFIKKGLTDFFGLFNIFLIDFKTNLLLKLEEKKRGFGYKI